MFSSRQTPWNLIPIFGQTFAKFDGTLSFFKKKVNFKTEDEKNQLTFIFIKSNLVTKYLSFSENTVPPFFYTHFLV
jgi:hypothetical protein